MPMIQERISLPITQERAFLHYLRINTSADCEDGMFHLKLNRIDVNGEKRERVDYYFEHLDSYRVTNRTFYENLNTLVHETEIKGIVGTIYRDENINARAILMGQLIGCSEFNMDITFGLDYEQEWTWW